MQLWVRRYAETGGIENCRAGPKPKAYSSARHYDIVARHKADPFLSTRTTATAFDVSTQTIRRHLHFAGLRCRKPAKKILLSRIHQEQRINFARNFINFDWENNVVIFTDEKTFKSDKDGRKILWRRDGERYKNCNLLPCRTSGRITVGYWGWMSSMGPGELVEIAGRNNSHDYLDILENVMLPTVRVAYPHEHIYFVQDNSAVHRARIVQNWFQNQVNMTVIDWPAKSPDLNPIENLWGHMVLNWDSSNIKSKANLDNVVMSTWESLRGTNICANMVQSMSRRLQEVIDREGLPTHY